jgi:hypothetical protein
MSGSHFSLGCAWFLWVSGYSPYVELYIRAVMHRTQLWIALLGKQVFDTDVGSLACLFHSA